MGGEIDALAFELGGQRARVDLAGFEAIGDQDHRGLFLGIAKVFGSEPHRIRERRHALGIDLVGGGGDGCTGARRRLDQHFDIAAIALFAMAIGHQAQFEVVRQAGQHGIEGFARNGDARLAVDLGPHGAGAVENDDGAFCRDGRKGQAKRGDRAQNELLQFMHWNALQKAGCTPPPHPRTTSHA